MAYSGHTHTHSRLAGITGVALVHLVLAAGLIIGMTFTGQIKPFDTNPDATNFPLPQPSPTEEPVDERVPPTDTTKTTTPKPPVDVNTSQQETTQEEQPPHDTGPIYDHRPQTTDDTGPPVEIPQVRPTTPPRGAAPRNGSTGWVTTQDYPRSALQRGWEGTLGYIVDVTTNGRATNCRITSSSGHEVLDDAACRQIERRARFRSATDSNGQEVTGTYRGSVSWQIPED